MTEPSSEAESFRELTLGRFVERLASSDPVPGGGSASAVGAALGAALVAMVAALSEGRPRYADHAELIGQVGARARALADELLVIADDDAAAYAAFGSAGRLPRTTPGEQASRSAAMAAAARTASEIPLRCVEAAAEVVSLAESLAGRSNVNASSDLRVAALLGQAAARGAAANVLVNLPSVDDPTWAEATTKRVDALLEGVDRTAAETIAAVDAGSPRAALTAPRS